ncbi:hemerythrin domain-containing protein [Rugamonas sp. CCM 8940]|uniref:hemerythrin domain-containing protein n=1 Tax=Rugamonas sp. CCM 8940 TaxID=2765359 RepID=UPI0018F69F61|nr:hemerythrin domain-containing protein [Rugamonas sp. CCM 8940]MBJ7312233.1 hemerythrin domain-containing protein [Rugamonas sp. CCM 8940]
MSTIGNFLGRDHRMCDDLYTLAEARVATRNWPCAGADFADFRQCLEHHLRLEEAVLFPALELCMGHNCGPTSVMRDEHRQMRELVRRMAATIGAHQRDDFFDLAHALRMLMRQHHLKEEGILYPMIDRFLSERHAELIAAMDKLDAPPEPSPAPAPLAAGAPAEAALASGGAQ